jgi:serine/threonine protein kinase
MIPSFQDLSIANTSFKLLRCKEDMDCTVDSNPHSNYEIFRKQIGKGAYGTVFLAKNKTTGEKLAVKNIRDVFASKADAKCALREISILRRLDHPAIIPLIDILQPSDCRDIRLVFSFYKLDLRKLYAQIPTCPHWGLDTVQYLMFQLVSGLAYMHSRSIVHRDIKPENLLVNEAFELKICDFGLARSIVTEEQAVRIRAVAVPRSGGRLLSLTRPCIKRQLTTHVVTRWYRSPELLVEAEDYSTGVDMWSAGCIMGELLQSLGIKHGGQRISPIFPGRGSSASGDAGGVENDAQLAMILGTMGTPTREELAGYGDGRTRRALQRRGGAPSAGRDIKQLLCWADDVSISLLKSMLHLDSSQRITATAALEHRFFSDMDRGGTPAGAAPIATVPVAVARPVTNEAAPIAVSAVPIGERCGALEGPFRDDPIALDFEFAGETAQTVHTLRELVKEEAAFYARQQQRRSRYAKQLAQLSSMGFEGLDDRNCELLLELLLECGGDVTRTVERLLVVSALAEGVYARA